MRMTFRTLIAWLALPCVIAAVAFTRTPQENGRDAVAHIANARADINDLAWMAGCWSLVRENRIVEEQWMAPRGGMMIGMSRTVRPGTRFTDFEATRIEQHGDTVIFYAQPSGQPASSFPAKVVSKQEVVFENLAHDFPQRVIYRNGGDSLHARIEGMNEGKLMEIPFPMARTACPGNPASKAGVGTE